MGRVLLVVAVLVLATGLGLWWRARNGRFTAVDPRVVEDAEHTPTTGDDTRLTAAEIGAPLGSRVTFVQMSSAVCTPCRRTHAVLAQVAAEHEGVSHVELDVEEHLDLVRRFHVMRTPTTLLVDAHGVVVGRLSGATDRRHALAALASRPDGSRPDGSCPDGVLPR
ncbi:thioredoxin family protein [Cellulomonas sp.]|uniref:TlpA family protein disulfide reductase n=1 Tax=Cellulomonas sp. TaxID=40001 RepID=UPI001B27CEBA|nr:thioredoxin family protein [Cellulomonas sp.]MBO9555279.1 thioredoxin family protein [Cellulomonas sp.]